MRFTANGADATGGAAPYRHLAFSTPDSAWDTVARRLLLVAIFFSGWNLLRVGNMNLTLADLALLSSFLITAMRGRLGTMPFAWLTPFWLIGLAMMLGGLFVGSVINADPLRWVNIALQYIVAYLFIPMLLMQQDEKLTRIAPLIFVLGTTLSEIIGIVATMLLTYQDTLPWLGNGFITGNGRLGSMAGQPNPNGAMVAFSLPMLLYAMRVKLIPVLPAAICFGLLVWGVMLSASFTGFSSSLLAIAVTLLLMGQFRYIARLGLAAIVAGGLFVASGAPLPKAFQERVGSAVETGDLNQAGTFVDRSALIKEAWDYTEDYSVIGMGVDRYRELSAHDNPVHNLYLLIWNEGGIVAFAGLMTMFFILCLMAAGGARDRERGAPAVAVLIVFFIYTMSYPHMYSRMWVMPVMIMMTLVYGRHRVTESHGAQLIYTAPAGPHQLPHF